MDAVRSPAEIYDEQFVPALFGPWGPVIAKAAGIAPGQAVLDVACGTGAATLAAAGMVGPNGHVAGLDANPDMLAVARRKSAEIDWRRGRAENLPFEDASYDAVISQFALMFFDDRPRALAEMMRVLKPGGRLAVAVCDAVERSPGYAAFASLLDRLFGNEVGDAFRGPFALGNAEELYRIAAAAGIEGASVEAHNGTVRFRSIAELVATERACVWTLGGILDDEQFDRLLRQSQQALKSFAGKDGMVEFDMPSLILVAAKSERNIPLNEHGDSEAAAIGAIVKDYFLGMHECDLERLRRVFNPQCRLFGEDAEGSHELTLADFLEFIESGPSPKAEGEPFDMRLVSVDRSGPVGMAKAEVCFRGDRYTDYLMLHKTAAGWSIVSKAFFSPHV